MEHGNVTLFEWQSGKRPTKVEAVELDFGASDDEDDAAKDVDDGEVSNSSNCWFHCFSDFLHLVVLGHDLLLPVEHRPQTPSRFVSVFLHLNLKPAIVTFLSLDCFAGALWSLSSSVNAWPLLRSLFSNADITSQCASEPVLFSPSLYLLRFFLLCNCLLPIFFFDQCTFSNP